MHEIGGLSALDRQAQLTRGVASKPDPLAEIDEGFDQVAPPPALGGFLDQELERDLRLQRIPIRTPRRQGIVDVDDAHDLGEHWNVVAAQTIRIPGTVQVLVMVPHDRAHASPGPGWILAAAALAGIFSTFVLRGMETGTISSTTPRLEARGDPAARALGASGYDVFDLAGADPAEVAAPPLSSFIASPARMTFPLSPR